MNFKYLIIFCMLYDRSAARVMNKLIYQKDISEHCRRHVFPSVFLGRQVEKANSQILQFSQLELPYSCFISIRTESGSNMVMVIQLASDDLKRSCSRHSEQLLVYEIGETFGGYWGPLPDSVLKQPPTESSLYTLRTTHHTTTTTQMSSEPTEWSEEESDIQEETSNLSTSQQQETARDTESEHSLSDYIEVEIPIVNVTIHMDGPMQPFMRPVDPDMAFDAENDVTPIAGEKYETKVMQLVQFSIREEFPRRHGDDEAPKYELDVVGEYTPDIRLTVPKLGSTRGRKPFYKRRYYQSTKRLNFKKNKHFLGSNKYFNRPITARISTKYVFPTKLALATEKSENYNESWDFIEDLFKNLNVTEESPDKVFNISGYKTNILENIDNVNHNRSVYLLSDWSQYTKGREYIRNSMYTGKYSTKSYNTAITNNYSIAESLSTNALRSYSISSNQHIQDSSTKSYKIQENSQISEHQGLLSTQSFSEDKNATELYALTEGTMLEFRFFENVNKGPTIDMKNQSISTGSLVDHESWENLVQAAPEMAIKLNRSVAYDTGYTTDGTTQLTTETRHEGKLLIRKKKEIHAIYIDDARPHNLTTKVERTTTLKTDFDLSDMQDFAQLVELQDYELHGRVALRYLRQYAGPALYNLCDLAESTPRHVHLFNSSRIVLAISNFSLDRMVIVLTSARTLLGGEMRCPSSHLECQVSGARACLDSTVACDGVPNCGSFDIYDEDRLLCGASKGLHHNVCLAAFTVLAVLLTVLYAVHYWLKRCVPKVADAFFVYTNGMENALYLDTIMRSPNDPDDMSKLLYPGDLYGYDNIYDDIEIKQESNLCRRFLNKCCACLRKKKKIEAKNEEEKRDEYESFTNLQRRRLHSFTLSELYSKYTSCDTSVQTGSSIEMKYLEIAKQKKLSLEVEEISDAPSSPPILIQDSILTLDEPLPENPSDDLSLTRFFRAARKSESFASVTNLATLVEPEAKYRNKSEIELKTFTYDSIETRPGPSRKKPQLVKKSLGESPQKHLRFDDVTTTISLESYDDEQSKDNMDHQRIVQHTEGKSRQAPSQHLDTIEEGDEQNPGAKESHHFWGTCKLKRSKKKGTVMS